MSERELVTKAEAEALRGIGRDYEEGDVPGLSVWAYRAGFRDGSKPPETRVFYAGDPEPGPEIIAVEDEDGDIWNRCNGGWRLGETQTSPWRLVLTYGPLVAGLPAPNAAYDAAVAADRERRNAEQAAGGAQ